MATCATCGKTGISPKGHVGWECVKHLKIELASAKTRAEVAENELEKTVVELKAAGCGGINNVLLKIPHTAAYVLRQKLISADSMARKQLSDADVLRRELTSLKQKWEADHSLGLHWKVACATADKNYKSLDILYEAKVKKYKQVKAERDEMKELLAAQELQCKALTLKLNGQDRLLKRQNRHTNWTDYLETIGGLAGDVVYFLNERDALHADYNQLGVDYLKLETDRDALAERLEAAETIVDGWKDGDGWTLDYLGVESLSAALRGEGE